MSTTPNIDSAIRLQHLQQMLHKGFSSQLLFCQELPPSIKVPALISCRMYYEATVQLLNQQVNSPLHLLWLVASSHMIQANYEEYYQKLKGQKEQKYKQLADDWIKMNKPLHHPPEVKALLRKKFEQLLLLAQEQNYFTNAKMPVFLVSCKWLQSFYNDNLSYIPAVDNSDLFSSMHWIQTDPKYMHYNYQLKQSCRQNVDYKIVPFEAWQFLAKNFGGMQFRRFTTNEKQPICQLSLNKVKIVIVQNRYVIGFQVFQILVSRFDTIALIIERMKRILISYGLIQFQSLSSSWQPVLISHLGIEQFIDVIQDDSKDLIKLSSQSSFQMSRLQFDHDIEDSQYNYSSDLIMFNLQKNKKSFIDMFSIPYKKTTKKYNKCLTCNTTQKLQECICKQVYFCCKECKMKNKQHLKNCQNLMKQQSIVARLVDFYGVHKRKYEFKDIKNGGKVGLQNLGNTCYMNAALQCVLSIDVLNQFFVSNQHTKQLNVTNVLGSQGHLTCAYGELVKDYYVTNRRALQPIKVLKIISSKNAQFRGYNHQDSQQFFNYFFDKLHQDLNRVRDKPYIQNIESDGRPDEIISQLSWRNYSKRNNSFISDNFAGQYRSQIRCPDCQRISITFDPFLSLTLQFPKPVSITEIIGYFLSNEGQFIKVKQRVNSVMNSAQFLQKYFKQPVLPIWLKNKQPQTQWKMKKNVGYNDATKKILVFYPKPANCNVEIVYKYTDYDILHRKIFVDQVKDQEHLLKIMYQYLKVPILKATKKDQLLKMSLQQYLKNCQQHKFLELVQKQQLNYPMKQGKIKIKLKIVQQKLPPTWILEQKLKFDVSIKVYQPKNKMKAPRSIDEQLTIQNLIQSFSQPEQLTEQNSWYCNKCKQHKLAQKIMSIYKVPKFLIVHLKRFNHRGNRYVIYGEKVKTPVKLFINQTFNGHQYELFGVVNHMGTLTMGHYTAYVKRDEGWFYADDSSFKRRQPEGTGAYLLFYKRVE